MQAALVAPPPIVSRQLNPPPVLAPAACRDQLDRPLKDLRLSVIDQCNFRCTYCMPKERFGRDYPFLSPGQRLSDRELLQIVRGFVSLGVEKVRLTGGEPLLRKGIESLVEGIASMSSTTGRPVEVAMTTNGSLLARKARSLRDAGLRRVTVSLDSLDDRTFRAMNDVDFPVQRVLEGIDAACAAGLAPVKVNCVVERGTNDGQVLPLVEHFRGSDVTLRFIEYMDVEGPSAWSRSRVMPSDEIRAIVERAHALVPVVRRSSETASNFLLADGSLKVGFISSVSHPFCGDCTRARVSVDGRLFLCLFATDSIDLRCQLAASRPAEAIADAVRDAWQARGDRYSELREERRANGKRQYPTVRMSLVGG
ncbi:GTP 3',8-cyclase MoaA [Cupriavidus numazuensis]|uniref:GTP 3',8-cyclase n=1 Tax=Cupriavidus numazuensis TaxID=221992 RepID=A0ABM8TNX9_9BURK|nr:GTP 3',8-cyclase MoaA [Cupriavidus numazuensis]CAG2156559.1 GTP 3',8-cyclase [Cupriavidus numazuensis]